MDGRGRLDQMSAVSCQREKRACVIRMPSRGKKSFFFDFKSML